MVDDARIPAHCAFLTSIAATVPAKALDSEATRRDGIGADSLVAGCR